MKKKDKKNKFFLGLFSFLFLIYMTIYVSQASGYYEFKNYRKASLTDEALKKFESDIKKGKKVDLSSYVISSNTNYSNKISDTGMVISDGVSELVNLGINSFFKVISHLAEN